MRLLIPLGKSIKAIRGALRVVLSWRAVEPAGAQKWVIRGCILEGWCAKRVQTFLSSDAQCVSLFSVLQMLSSSRFETI